MLRFEMDVALADLSSRTIEGVMVPYDEVGVIAGREYRFRPGSLRLERQRTPLLVDHDRAHPIGVLAELVERPSGVLARFTIDATPEGDHALIQAASGSRGSLSIGAEVERSTIDARGVVDVTAGSVHEVSLLALGAFRSAAVTRVAAEADEPKTDDEDEDAENPDQTELELGDEGSVDRTEVEQLDEDDQDDDDDDAGDADADTDPEEETPMGTAEATAGPRVIIAAGADRPPRELTAGEYVKTMLEAQRGDREAQAVLQAALTETISTDIPGLLPPTYEASVIGPAPVDRILYDVFKGKSLPGVGLAIQKPVWTTLPVGAWAATVDADATTSKAVIGLNPAAIERWDWATALSYTAVQRSSPDAISTIYAAAVENFHLAVEVKIAALLDTTAGTPNAAVKLGAAIAAFYTRAGRVPDVILVAPDVWGLLADAGVLSIPFGVSGSAIAGEGGLRSSYAGLSIVSSGALAAGTKYLATRRALDCRITEPVQLTANAIGALNVELGVVGEGLFDADVALEVMELTAGTPVGLAETKATK